MTAEAVQVWLFAGAFLVAFFVGLRSSWRLLTRYRRARHAIDPRNRLVLKVVVVASWMITIAAGWFGSLSVIRLMTDFTFPWTPPVTLALSTMIVFIPLLFDLAISRVARIEHDDDN